MCSSTVQFYSCTCSLAVNSSWPESAGMTSPERHSASSTGAASSSSSSSPWLISLSI
eukprot:m.309159 g.309159  ORF g.309159 m.309159 type:complete len:57 (+) comp45644_c0_seq1:598-768(+)